MERAYWRRVDWGMGAAGWGRKPARLASTRFGEYSNTRVDECVSCERGRYRHASRRESGETGVADPPAPRLRSRPALRDARRAFVAAWRPRPAADAELLELTRPARRRTSWPLCVSPPRGTEAASRSSTTIDPVEPWLDLAERRGLGLGDSGGVSAWRRRRIALAGSRRIRLARLQHDHLASALDGAGLVRCGTPTNQAAATASPTTSAMSGSRGWLARGADFSAATTELRLPALVDLRFRNDDEVRERVMRVSGRGHASYVGGAAVSSCPLEGANDNRQTSAFRTPVSLVFWDETWPSSVCRSQSLVSGESRFPVPVDTIDGPRGCGGFRPTAFFGRCVASPIVLERRPEQPDELR